MAIFAHNEAGNILACLRSILAQDKSGPLAIHVLANGCTDTTERVVETFAAEHLNITLVSLEQADKSSAWNHYIQRVAPDCACHFFVDGDLEIDPGSFLALHNALAAKADAVADAVAAGAMPASGRTRQAWAMGMSRRGRLAGGLYALRGDFVQQLRDWEAAIPAGFIGDDLFVTCLAKGRLNARGLNEPSPRVCIAKQASFRFASLSRRSPRHWNLYLKRLVRYQLRTHQLNMLFHAMHGRSPRELPADVQELYARAPYLARYRWAGASTLFDMIAVWKIRRALGKWV